MSTGSPRTPPSQLSPPSRAITSTLSARAAPSVPPATQTYEPLARAALRRRLLYDILPPSILPVWISTIFWKTWDVGEMSVLNVLKALTIPFHPSTLFVTIFVWAFGVLPIIVLRKSQLTGESVNWMVFEPDLTVGSCSYTLVVSLTTCQSHDFQTRHPSCTFSVHSHEHSRFNILYCIRPRSREHIP
jgi:nucleoporin NDC1